MTWSIVLGILGVAVGSFSSRSRRLSVGVGLGVGLAQAAVKMIRNTEQANTIHARAMEETIIVVCILSFVESESPLNLRQYGSAGNHYN